MILYLLFPLFIMGVEESQTANTTEEPSKAEGNQTLTQFNNSTTRLSNNATSSLYSLRDVEKKMGNNQSSAVIADYDESFQDQDKFIHGPCHRELLIVALDVMCGADFHEAMQTISPENWCLLKSIRRPYSDMTTCLERLSDLVDCFYPNPDTQDFFLKIHSHYFVNCTGEEHLFEDAPHGLVMVLTLIPVSLIPVLVYLVIWKSKVQE